MEFRRRQDKLATIAAVLDRYLDGPVLDVGCDDKSLKNKVRGRYFGVDLYGTPDVKIDLEDGLPFRTGSFQTVLAFDVLEHLERVHYTFDELARVSKRFIIIGLPNQYEWRFRLHYLLGKQISGKYGLPVRRPADRHRWVFSLEEAREFVSCRGRRAGYKIVQSRLGYYSYNKMIARAITAFGQLAGAPFASLFAYYYLVVLERRADR